jgi:glycosyltransferase involved in cell wall biosynthesis
MNVVIFSVVPSPYQRDLFIALAERENINLQVYYLERAAPDSPWLLSGLRDFEHVLPGLCFGRGQVRSHINWALPALNNAQVVILNTSITDFTTQYLMRGPLRKKNWVFWAEISAVQKRKWKQRISAFLYAPHHTSSATVAIGSNAQEAYQKQWPDQKVFNLPYHIQCPVSAVKETGREEVRFLFCGQMIYRKAIDILLAAFTTVIEKGLTARLLLVGREAELRTFLKDISADVKDRIDYLGFRQPAELPELFSSADVFVLPSRRDGWGVVVNQAVSAGLPVIASDAVGAARDLVRSGENGFCVPAGEPAPLAEAMIQLAEDASLRQRFGSASLALAESITPAAGAAKFERILHEVIA